MLEKLKKKVITCVSLIGMVGILFISMIAGMQNDKSKIVAASANYAYNQGNIANNTTVSLSEAVIGYRIQITMEAANYGTEPYVELFMAVMMQESCGAGNDVFQCSESLGLERNSLSVDESIEQGVYLLSSNLQKAGVESPQDIEHIRLALQGYNFGPAYIDYALEHDGGWTQENTNDFAELKSNGVQNTGSAATIRGQWKYGDQHYTDHVLRFYSYANSGYSDIVEYAKTFLGCPYEWGAAGPNKFDCSGLVYYVYKGTGRYSGARTTAACYYELATQVSKNEAVPGDLVFFRKDGRVHHIGIYIGDGKMIHAPQPGDVVKIASAYISGEIVTFGKLAD